MEGKARAEKGELERKRAEWEEVESAVRANAAKLEDVVELNVGGKRFTTTKATLLKHRGSFFDALLDTNHSLRSKNGEFFIDHDPKYFRLILNFLRDGEFLDSDIKDVVLDELGREFDFFKIPRPLILEQQKIKQMPALLLPFEGGTLLSDDLKKKVTEWVPQKKFSLLYKAMRDGFDANDFHQKCDNKGPTITVIQSQGGYLFGGYTSQSWESKGGWKDDPAAFIFTLTNPHSLPPTQYPILPGNTRATYYNPSQCAAFGGGHDIGVYPASHHTRSYTFFPGSFRDTTGKGKETFTGAYNFTATDVEVYSVL